MSFLSVVKRSKAASMAALSVLASTTRKFFWESGGAVTCCSGLSSVSLPSAAWSAMDGMGTYADTCEEEASHGVLLWGMISACSSSWRRGPATNLVPNDGEELPVFVGGWCSHRVVSRYLNSRDTSEKKVLSTSPPSRPSFNWPLRAPLVLSLPYPCAHLREFPSSNAHPASQQQHCKQNTAADPTCDQ